MSQKEFDKLPKHPHISELLWLIANEDDLLATEHTDPDTSQEYVIVTPNKGIGASFKFIKRESGYELIRQPYLGRP